MHISQHADQRMNQRGISRRLVEFALRHGRVEGDRHVLDREESQRLIEQLKEELRLAKRVLDKGGVTVVEGSDTVITTYNVRVPLTRRRFHHAGGLRHHYGSEHRHHLAGGFRQHSDSEPRQQHTGGLRHV